MFGRSRWRVGDMEASGTPAVGFTLTASNPSETAPLELSFFFALLLQRRDPARPTQPTEQRAAPRPATRLRAAAYLPG